MIQKKLTEEEIIKLYKKYIFYANKNTMHYGASIDKDIANDYMVISTIYNLLNKYDYEIPYLLCKEDENGFLVPDDFDESKTFVTFSKEEFINEYKDLFNKDYNYVIETLQFNGMLHIQFRDNEVDVFRQDGNTGISYHEYSMIDSYEQNGDEIVIKDSFIGKFSSAQPTTHFYTLEVLNNEVLKKRIVRL